MGSGGGASAFARGSKRKGRRGTASTIRSHRSSAVPAAATERPVRSRARARVCVCVCVCGVASCVSGDSPLSHRVVSLPSAAFVEGSRRREPCLFYACVQPTTDRTRYVHSPPLPSRGVGCGPQCLTCVCTRLCRTSASRAHGHVRSTVVPGDACREAPVETGAAAQSPVLHPSPQRATACAAHAGGSDGGLLLL